MRWLGLAVGTTVVVASGCHLALPLEMEPGGSGDAKADVASTDVRAALDAVPDGPDLAAPDALHDIVLDQASTDQSASDTGPDKATPDQSAPDKAVPDQSQLDQAASDLGAPAVYTYTSPYAVCTSPLHLSTADCETDTGAGLMTVDIADDTTGYSYYIFLRFDLDAKIAGKVCTSAKVTLTVADKGNAKADQSGELYQVGYFDVATLANGPPNTVQLLGADQGPVVLNQPVTWTIPTSLVSANGKIYLGVFPTTTDGVEYWNSKTPAAKVPPVLVVTCK